MVMHHIDFVSIAIVRQVVVETVDVAPDSGFVAEYDGAAGLGLRIFGEVAGNGHDAKDYERRKDV